MRWWIHRSTRSTSRSAAPSCTVTSATTAITPSIYKAERILEIAKEMHPGAVTVLGGIHATFMYGQVLAEAPWIDAVVRGEGEEIIVDLVRAIRNRAGGLERLHRGRVRTGRKPHDRHDLEFAECGRIHWEKRWVDAHSGNSEPARFAKKLMKLRRGDAWRQQRVVGD